jgi:hypothetical protein
LKEERKKEMEWILQHFAMLPLPIPERESRKSIGLGYSFRGDQVGRDKGTELLHENI